MSEQKFGTDEWVASYQQRLVRPTGWRGFVYDINRRMNVWTWLAVLVVIGVLIPPATQNDYVIHVAGTVALMATLGIGLNVVVGYAGLLDLGFVAFYGIGGYTYAYLSSDFSGVHWPTWISLIVITVIAALFGLLLGSPSLRLIGDYLAIVTLGFGQIFVQLTTSMTRVNVPGIEKPLNLTGGPNGIVNLDPARFFGFTAKSVTDYYYILLAMLVVILVVVYHLYGSRLGRAWRAMREDELAAGAMGIPTRRLKLMAFAMGAGIAGLSGALFASWQGSVFPTNFDVTLLITIYAIIVLGGLGSLPGVVIGALIMIAAPEALRNIALAGVLFYAGILVILLTTLKPRWQFPAALGALVVLGLLLRLIFPSSGSLPASGSSITEAIRSWLVLPSDPTRIGNLAFLALIFMVLLVSRLKNARWRFGALVPTLYLMVFVWETRLSQEPSVTRLIFVGVLLVVLMIYRPQGLLGKRRVEIV